MEHGYADFGAFGCSKCSGSVVLGQVSTQVLVSALAMHVFIDVALCTGAS